MATTFLPEAVVVLYKHGIYIWHHSLHGTTLSSLCDASLEISDVPEERAHL